MLTIRPNGTIVKTVEVSPLIIKRDVVNNKISRKSYRANELTSDVNGVMLQTGYVGMTVIGNISLEQVKQVINEFADNQRFDMRSFAELKQATSYKEVMRATEPYYFYTTVNTFGNEGINTDNNGNVTKCMCSASVFGAPGAQLFDDFCDEDDGDCFDEDGDI